MSAFDVITMVCTLSQTIKRTGLLLKSSLHDATRLNKALCFFACILVTQLIVVFVHVDRSSSTFRKTESALLPPCHTAAPHLVGSLKVSYYSPTFANLESLHPELEPGGRWRPSNCTAVHRLALVIPYRDREVHLRTFLRHMHPFLQRQQLDYGIYVVEQASSNSFNRGMLMNIGFVEAMQEDRRWQCFIFHDVDLLPESNLNLYSCPQLPRHMSVAVDAMAYRLMYDGLFGGVEAFSVEHFKEINGFSNKFFGWGGEDDDLYQRILSRGLNLTRYPRHIARYRMLNHVRSSPNARRSSLLRTSESRVARDGLSSLSGGYVTRIERKKLYTLIYADINQKYVQAH